MYQDGLIERIKNFWFQSIAQHSTYTKVRIKLLLQAVCVMQNMHFSNKAAAPLGCEMNSIKLL